MFQWLLLVNILSHQRELKINQFILTTFKITKTFGILSIIVHFWHSLENKTASLCLMIFHNMLFQNNFQNRNLTHVYWFAYALVMNHYMYKNREIFLNFPLLYLPNLTYKEIQRSREIQTIHVLSQHSLNHVLDVSGND